MQMPEGHLSRRDGTRRAPQKRIPYDLAETRSVEASSAVKSVYMASVRHEHEQSEVRIAHSAKQNRAHEK